MVLPWPLPALAAWAGAWGVFLAGVRAFGWPPPLALLAAALAGFAASAWAATRWRRLFVAAGFPVSAALWGLSGTVSAWLWLAPLAALAWLYPLRTWRDAPMFPTPPRALCGLADRAPLPPGARVLDAGCGLGDALVELHREYPHAHLEGIEWSRPLRWACALRARFAHVRRGDLWASDWSGHDLVYVFQRPETMARIGRKARAEMKAGAWLVSLEFPVPGWTAAATWASPGGRTVWVYRRR